MRIKGLIKQLNTLAMVTTATFFAGLSSPGYSDTLDISDVPLFVGVDTVPNVFIELDDSGSMDWEVLAGQHFISCSYAVNPNGQTCAGFTSNDVMRFPETIGSFLQNFLYYSNVVDQTLDQGCPDINSNVNGIAGSARNCLASNYNPLVDEWRFFSSDLNLMFFNPSVDYKPWVGFDDASFTSARSNPQPGTAGFSDTTNLSGFEFTVWIDDRGFVGGRPDPFANDMTDTPNGIVDLWDSHVRVKVNQSSIECAVGRYASNGGNPARPVRSEQTISLGECLQLINAEGTSAFELRQSIANWYQYARRRSFVAKSAVVNVLSEIDGLRYGFSVINNHQDLFVEMPDADVDDFTQHNENLRDALLDYVWTSRGTPLRTGLERTGEYYDTDNSGLDDTFDSPIVESCQQNFAVLFSDGFWNGANPSSAIGDRDGDGATLGENDVITLADVAFEYYERDLAPGLDPNVPTDAFDRNTDQHMVTYTIAFGLQGNLQDTNGDGFPDPGLEIDSSEWWDESINTTLRRVDDLWHAAFNTRGQFISAERPEDISDALSDAIGNIESRTGTAASGSTNGGSITTESRIFQAIFHSGDWHSDLLAFDVGNDGSISNTPVWNAGELLNLRGEDYFESERVIATFNPESDTGVLFEWDNLTDTQQAQLNASPNSGISDGRGEERIRHIRGVDDPDEPFRVRENRLGDLVNSDPQFVGAPRFFLPFNDYQTFFNNNRERTPVLYVGGNDGMLHAFDAESGEELFNYIPNAVIKNLNELTDPDYEHTFYVDGSPAYGDAFYDGGWHSVLASGLRSGGQAVYALDVTDPSPNVSAASRVLWEFSDEDDSDLGLTFSKPRVAKMNNDQWAVIFGNGYNSTAADGNASTDGDAALFILFIEAGIGGFEASDFIKIKTGAGSLVNPNGLGPASVADVNGDSRVDYIYAGDLEGNLWKFDVTSSDPNSWGVSFGGQPLFTATSANGDTQPILSAPTAIAHPFGISQGALILVGTGKYVEPEDKDPANGGVQSLYAVWDRDASLQRDEGENGFSRSEFAQIQLGTSSTFRVVNENASDVPNWLDEDGNPVDRGWFVDLPEQGERVVREVLVRSGIVFFVTLIPSEEPCVPGGSGFLMALDANTGGIPNPDQQENPVPFDINGDGEFDESDLLGSGEVPIGLAQNGIPNLPAVIFDPRPLCERNPQADACQDDDGDNGPPGADTASAFPPPLNSFRGCGNDGQRIYLYTTTSDGTISEATASLDNINCGRQGWRQLR